MKAERPLGAGGGCDNVGTRPPGQNTQQQQQQQGTGGQEVEIGVPEAGGGDERGKDHAGTDSEASSLRKWALGGPCSGSRDVRSRSGGEGKEGGF